MKIVVSWSSGKDSAWTLHMLRAQHPGCTAALLTTINEAFDRVAMHAVRRSLVTAQAEAAGLPLYAIDLPWPCSNEVYESRMADAVHRLEADGFTHIAFGDLFLEDVRRYREERLAGTGLTPLFPLWKTKPTRDLADEMIDGGLRACLTSVDPRILPPEFAGRQFDRALLSDLPEGVDSCGENGEFHSFVWDGPMFSRPLAVEVGERVTRDGFVFADVVPVAMTFPHRIVCLTEETTETLYLLGEGDRVVGVSGYTVRPPEARSKPRISSFLHARFDKIEALQPDLVLAFSDLQAEITGELIKRGYPVFTFNQRSVDEILQMIRVLGAIVGCPEKGHALADELGRGLQRVREEAARLPRRPRVYFEEWDDPLISGIRWVEELVQIAGGDPVFPELRNGRLAKERIVTSEQIIAAAPDIIIGSWCGKPVRREKIAARAGWDQVPAVRLGQIHEIKSAYILQPGPAALTEGLAQVQRIVNAWASA